MVTHRIKELRKMRHLSQEQLGDKIGRSKSVISRLEDGATKLDLETAARIAEALDASLTDVLAIEDQNGRQAISGLSEDMVPYEPSSGDPMGGAFLTQNQYLLVVEANVLDKAGIIKGDVVVVDQNAAVCKLGNIPPLKPVRVRWHSKDDFMKPVTLLRQFVPPSLLITNSSEGNTPSLDMDIDDVHIVGVVVSSTRRFAGGHS